MSKSFKINPNVKLGSTSPRATSISEVSDPFAVAPALPTVEEYVKAMQEQRLDDKLADALSKYYAVSAYGAIYSKVSGKLQSIIKAVDDMRDFYLTEVILNQISEDALAPRIGSDEIVNYSCQNEVIQKELDELKKRIGLDQLILNITPDLCAYGEYTLATKIDNEEIKDDELNDDGKPRKKVKKKSEGILDVTDIVDQGTVISLTQDGKVEGYLKLSEITGSVEVKEVADYVKFQLGGQRIRLDVKSLVPPAALKNPELKELFDKIPRFLRVGKSMLYPVLSKLKELELLEKLVPATKLNKLSQGNLVGLPLPDNYDLDQALKASRRVEGMINKKVQVDPNTREITVEAILSTAGKTRVIPILGEKGNLEKLDYKSDEPDDLLGSSKEIRELILDSIGVPSELIYKSEGDSKGEILKRYAKYLRKLKKVQKAISDGCRQIAFIHLANKGIKFQEEEIEVNFLNALVEIDNLDKLEHADVTISLLSNVRDFFNDMVEEDSPYREQIHLEKVSEYLESNLKTVGLSDAIKLAKEGGEEADKEAVDKDGIDSEGNPTRAEEPESEEPPAEDDEE